MLAGAASRLAALTILGLPAEGLTAAFEREFSSRPYAGVLVFRRHFGSTRELPALLDRIRSLVAPRRILVAMDEEGGFVSQLAPDFPVPPNARVLGRAASETEVERIAATVGNWLTALGVDVNFAPVLDVDSEAANPVIGPRSFGADPALVARLGGAALRGFREGGILATVKHFPGQGMTAVDSHLELPECTDDAATLHARDLVPFRDALHLAPLVMTAHVRYPRLDSRWPATLSPAILNGLLRGELGSRGVVVTDAMEMAGLAGAAPGGEGVLRALAAGCDLILIGIWGPEAAAALADAAERWEREGERALPETRWETARGAVEALFQAALAAERFERGEKRTPGESTRLDVLVPPSWDQSLEAICRRALAWHGAPVVIPGAGAAFAIEVLEPAWSSGPSIAGLLGEHGLPTRATTFAAATSGAAPGRTTSVAADFARLRAETGAPGRAAIPLVVALPRRTPLSPGETAELRALCADRPTVLVALEQDGFLADFEGAVGRLSACDATPAMRNAVAGELWGILSAGRVAR